jgi:hypothetical protein
MPAKSKKSDVRQAVAADKQRLQAFSNSSLKDDASRGAGSPLGSGTHSKDEPRRKGGKGK